LILQPAALLLLPALFKSLLLVATNSRQLTNSMSAFSSGGILSEYEFAFLVTLLQQVRKGGVPFVFTERKEYLARIVARSCL
jgi:hypothetical protein